MYLAKPLDKVWAGDIETESLTPEIIHVATFKNCGTSEEIILETVEDIKEFIDEKLAEGYVFVFHNALRFDAPVLNRLCGTRLSLSNTIDTLILSQVYNPSLVGGHSLESWGNRLRLPKTEFNDYSKYTPEMRDYCMQDTRICCAIYKALRKKMLSYGQSERGISLEHFSWAVIEKQRRNGFFFNKTEAEKLYIELKNIERELAKEIHEYWPPQLLPVSKYKRAFKRDGTHSKLYEGHYTQFPRIEIHSDGSYTAFDYVEFELGSPIQRLDKLIELGWKPREPTKSRLEARKDGRESELDDNRGWKVTEKGALVPSLEEFLEDNPDTPARALAEWISINARSTMINTWLEAYNPDTRCIHGNLFIASTLRYKHSAPNTANIPGVKVDDNDHPIEGRKGEFRYESRNLWQTRDPKTRTLVGVDAKGIQLRCLANYLNNESFTRNILSKDPHEANRVDFGLPTRSLAKTIVYSTLMGAGDAKIATTARVSLKEAKSTKALFFEKLPELPALIKRLQNELERTGRITLCDGSKLIVSSPHMVIPYLLQGDESRIMKQALILIDKACRREKLDVLFVGNIHDELQNDVLNEHVDRFREICEESFIEAGKIFNYILPVEGDSKCGKGWGSTH